MSEPEAAAILAMVGLWVVCRFCDVYVRKLNGKIKGLSPDYCPYCGHLGPSGAEARGVKGEV